MFQKIRQQAIVTISHLNEQNLFLAERVKILSLMVSDLKDKVSITSNLAQRTHTRATLSFETMKNVLRASVPTQSPFHAEDSYSIPLLTNMFTSCVVFSFRYLFCLGC